jgi:hypothetical protein
MATMTNRDESKSCGDPHELAAQDRWLAEHAPVDQPLYGEAADRMRDALRALITEEER